MNKPIFIDTAGWLALINRHDQLHNQAVKVYRTLERVPRLTTDAVIIETCNALSKPALRELAIALMTRIKEARELEVLKIVHVNKELVEQGWRLFSERPDKEWSLTDCISFVVMRRRGCHKAFTSDHHFEQAGLMRLLKP